jgi:hypothetical protein
MESMSWTDDFVKIPSSKFMEKIRMILKTMSFPNCSTINPHPDVGALLSLNRAHSQNRQHRRSLSFRPSRLTLSSPSKPVL